MKAGLRMDFARIGEKKKNLGHFWNKKYHVLRNITCPSPSYQIKRVYS